ncbi:reticuline oxidase, partial [Olea europaea subsp. europaea]
MIELGKIGMVFNTYGVKMDKIRKSAMPFRHLQGTSSNYSILQKCDQDDAASVKKYVEQTKTFHSNMAPLVSKNPREVFLNYRDLDIMILALLNTVKTLAMKQR